MNLPSHSQVVIIGGGIIGCSVAYHLTKLGWRDVVLLERGQLTCGTTWHAAGLVMQLRSTHTLTELCRYGAQLLSTLKDETGQDTGFRRTGSLPIARTAERLTEISRVVSLGKTFGVEAHMLSPREIRERYPLLDETQIVGGAFIPGDGQTNPVDSAQALAKGARTGGARIVENVTVTGFHIEGGAIKGIHTSSGSITCEVAVLSAGIWSRDLGALAGVHVPLYASEHMYVLTEPHQSIPRDLPVLRDADGFVYVKEDAGKLLVGSFEPRAKSLPMEKLPARFEFGELQEGGVGPPLNRGFSGPAAPFAPTTNAGPGNVRIPAAVSPHGVAEPRAGTKAKPKSASTERKAAAINPPLPPPAPREPAKADGSGSGAAQPTEKPDSGQPRINSASTAAGNGPSASAPAAQGLPTEASDKPKVSIVPPGLFQ